MDQGTRDELIGRLTEAIRSVTTAHPLRVAIDGPPAAEQDHAGRRARHRLARAGPRRHPRDHRRLPLPPCTALPARPVLGRRLLLRRPRPRLAVPGRARSAGPGRRPKISTRGLRQRYRHPTVTAGHDCPRRRHTALRRRLPPTPGTARSMGPAHLRVRPVRADRGTRSEPQHRPGRIHRRRRRSRTVLAQPLHPIPTALPRHSPPNRSRRHHRLQRRTPTANLGGQISTLIGTQDLTIARRSHGRSPDRRGRRDRRRSLDAQVKAERPDDDDGLTGALVPARVTAVDP